MLGILGTQYLTWGEPDWYGVPGIQSLAPAGAIDMFMKRCAQWKLEIRSD